MIWLKEKQYDYTISSYDYLKEFIDAYEVN